MSGRAGEHGPVNKEMGSTQPDSQTKNSAPGSSNVEYLPFLDLEASPGAMESKAGLGGEKNSGNGNQISREIIDRQDEILKSNSDGSDQASMDIFRSGPVTMLRHEGHDQILNSVPIHPKLTYDLVDKDAAITALQEEKRMLHGKIKGYQTLVVLYQQSRQEANRWRMECEQLRKSVMVQMPQSEDAATVFSGYRNEIKLPAAGSQLLSATVTSSSNSAVVSSNTETESVAGSISNADKAIFSTAAAANTASSEAVAAALITPVNSAAATARHSEENNDSQLVEGVTKYQNKNVPTLAGGRENFSGDNLANNDNNGSSNVNNNARRIDNGRSDNNFYDGSNDNNQSARDKLTSGSWIMEGSNIENPGDRDPRETELVRPRYHPSSANIDSPGGGGSGTWDLREVEVNGGRASDVKTGDISHGSGSTSSASFVRIGSSDRGTISRENSDLEDIKLSGFDDLNITKDRGTVERGAQRDVSLNDSVQSSNLSADLKRATDKALKLEKYCREKQAAIDRLTEENDSLKGRMNSLVQTLDVLKEFSLVDKSGRASASSPIASGQSAAATDRTAAAAVVAKDSELCQLTDSQSQSNQRQQDLMSELVQVKSALEEERQRGREKEEKIRIMMEKNSQLRAEMNILTQRQTALINAQLRESDDMGVFAESNAGHRDRVSSLKNQIQLLTQQLKVYVEDFDQERKDRGLAKAEADNYRRRVTELTRDNIALKQDLEKRDSELANTLNKNKRLEACCSQLAKDLQDYYIRRDTKTSHRASSRPVKNLKQQSHQTRSEDLTSSTSSSTLGQAQYRRVERPPEDAWGCPNCTFFNDSSRQKCEVCHTLRSPLGSHNHREYSIIADLHRYDSTDSPWPQQQQPQPYMELISRSDSNDKKVVRGTSDITTG